MMKKAAAMALVFSLCLSVPASAQLVYNSEQPPMSFLEGSQQRVSIDLRESDIIDVLKFLSQKGRFNIYISPRVQGRVTLFLQDVKIADILDILLISNGLAYYAKDSIVYILTQEEYKARYGENYDDARQVRLLRLKYASASQVFKMIEPTKSAIGSLVADEQSGTLILIETPEKLDFMERVVKELDQPVGTRVFDLSYGKAEEVASLLTTKLTNKGVESVNFDARSNQVIVTAFPDRMKEVEEIIKNLDRKTREVMIDTKIMKVILNDDRNRGIDWDIVYRKGFLEPLSLDFDFSQTLSAGMAISYTDGDRGQITSALNYLQTLGESKILASPRITVVEGEEAKILIGTKEAYVTSTTTTGSSTSTVSESISFVDVGISLSVSASINKDGYVTMKVKPEVSSVSRTLETTSGNDIPIVDSTMAETRVMVKDGTTIVIGGLRKDEKSSTVQRLPGLSNIPILGHLFRNLDEETEQTELVVFLTPHIIEGNKDMAFDENKRGLKGIQAYPEKPRSDNTGLQELPALKVYSNKKA
ncbi:MAG: hypothetical protein HY592_02045 [Candidatus Omnitrophica bacterium]|nr:hypothetical protein [Candidatus Omnitrophota bacterium]